MCDWKYLDKGGIEEGISHVLRSTLDSFAFLFLHSSKMCKENNNYLSSAHNLNNHNNNSKA